MKQFVDFTSAVFDSLGYFQKFHGLVKMVTVREDEALKRYPAKIGFEEVPVDFEPNMAYMRLGQVTSTELEEEACSRRVTRSFPFTVVMGLPNDILSTPNEYIALKVAQNVANSLQTTNTETMRRAIKADDVQVDISNINTDPFEVWTTERNDPYVYPTYRVLISMQVTFVVQGHISCFDILGCDDEEAELLQKYVDGDGVEKEAAFGSKIVCTPFCELFTETAVVDIEACFDEQSGARQDEIQAAICDPPTPISALTCLELNDASAGLTQPQRNIIQSVYEVKTGQTTSYVAGDDGALEDGRQVDFLTMTCVTPDGTTARFFDNGDGTVTDWATGKMWVKATQPAAAWATAIANAEALVFAGFSDWHMPNRRLMESLLYFDEVSYAPMISILGYAPFGIGVVNLWMSTTHPGTPADAYQVNTASTNLGQLDKTVSRAYMVYRNI